MKNIAFFTAILTAVALFSADVAICQGGGLTSREQGIYNAIMERWYADETKPIDEIISAVAGSHNLDENEVGNVYDKGMAREPSDAEWQIYKEANDIPLDTVFPGNQTVYEYVGARHGLSGLQVFEIYSRCGYWVMAAYSQ